MLTGGRLLPRWVLWHHCPRRLVIWLLLRRRSRLRWMAGVVTLLQRMTVLSWRMRRLSRMSVRRLTSRLLTKGRIGLTGRAWLTSSHPLRRIMLPLLWRLPGMTCTGRRRWR